jgi:RimJ/RimL family protein N-acetyltransferase
MTVPVLTGSRVVLRPPVEADVSARQELGLDPEIHRMFGGSRALLAPYTQEMALAWLSMMQEDPHAWAIDVGARLIGEIRLEKLEPVDRRATLAVGILDPAALGKGYGTEAVTLMLAHAFGALGLHRIGLRVLAYNERAIRCYQKCGFVIEGRERESALVDGAWHDDVMMGILATDLADGAA